MLTIRQNFWFPLAIRVVAYGLAFLAVVVFFSPYPTWSRQVILVIAFILLIAGATAREFILINMEARTCFEYRRVLGFKIGEVTQFEYLEKMFINRVKLVTDVNKYGPMVSPNSEYHSSTFKCFLKFDTGEKLMIDSDEDKEQLIKRLKDYNKILKTTVFDTSGPEPILIE